MSLALAVGPVAAQSALPVHRMPAVPADLLTRPIGLRTGIGGSHDAVATSPEAQRFYDQGLSYLHNYVWIEAARSFNQALDLDPRLTLAHVGVSLASTALNQRAAARAAFERARNLPVPGPHEERHLIVRERQMAAEDDPRDAAKLTAYRSALDAALAEFPNDVELWLQRGVAESVNAADRGQSSPITAVPYYEKALAIVPDHFAAHHYLTHAHENGGRIQDALAHGAAYARLAAAVPHARHMYGHDLRRVGRIQEAIAEFQAADRLETAFFAAEQVAPDNDWHHEHNLDLLGTSYWYTGQMRRAAPLLEKAFGLSTANLVQAVNKRQWPAFLRAHGRTEAALTAARVLRAHPNVVVQAIGHIEIAHVLLATGQTAAAAPEANAAIAALRKAEAGAGLASIEMQVLQGEFFLRTGQRDKGRAALQTAATQARAARGPDEWAQALFTLESIAKAARDAGDWDFVGLVASQMLEHDPYYAGAHYVAALVADHQGNHQRAATELAAAATLWSAADPDLPALVDVRARLRATR
jgi:tetratricopeptide (TPR) repeat protein